MSDLPSVLRPPAAAAAAVAAAAAAVDSLPAPVDDGGWAMADDTLVFLRALIAELAPRHVLEFGSGASTVVLAEAAGRLVPPAAVTSVENDPVAHQAARDAISASQGTAPATVQLAPLVARRIDGRHLPAYHVRPHEFASRRPPDVIVVDGPPAMLGGREGSLRQALSLAAVGSVVLLDDADRPAEAEVLAAVQRAHDGCLDVVPCPGFARGLGALVVTAPTAVRFDTDDAPAVAGAPTAQTRAASR